MSTRLSSRIAIHFSKPAISPRTKLLAPLPKSLILALVSVAASCVAPCPNLCQLAYPSEPVSTTTFVTSEGSPRSNSNKELPATRTELKEGKPGNQAAHKFYFDVRENQSANNPKSDKAENASENLSKDELESNFETFLFGELEKQMQAKQTLVHHAAGALAHFPLVTESIPASELSRLTELRAALELQENNRRKLIFNVSLDGDLNLDEAVRSIGQQAAVDIDAFRGAGNNATHHWTLAPQPFWQALDQILDRYEATLNAQFRAASLTVATRPFGASERVNVASYIGGHRVQPIAVCKLQNFSVPDQNSLRIDLEFSWDPKSVPSMLVVPAMELELQCDNGELLLPISTEPLVHAPEGELRSELSSLFSLPSRQAKKIDRWHGSFLTAYSGAMAGVLFDQLDPESKAEPRTLQSGILNISLEGIEKNGDLFQIRVGTSVDNDQIVDGLESLVLDSQQAYIIDASGTRIEHVGWTTERFNPNDVGMTFLFELENGLEGCKFVYLAPGAIHTTTHHFEIIDIPLP